LRDGRGGQEKNKKNKKKKKKKKMMKRERERWLKGKWAVVDGAQWN